MYKTATIATEKSASGQWTLPIFLGAATLLSTCPLILVAALGILPTLLLVRLFYGVFVLGALGLSSQQGLLPLSASLLRQHGWVSGSVLVFSYPIAAVIFGTIFVAIEPPQFLDFDDRSEETLRRLVYFKHDLALPLAILGGSAAIFLMAAGAVRVLAGKWPARLWIGSLGTPLFLTCLGMLPGSIVPGITMLFVLSVPVILGALIAFWMRFALKERSD